MSAIAIPSRIWNWRLLRELIKKGGNSFFIDGQFQPYQPIQFGGDQQGIVPGYGLSSVLSSLTFVGSTVQDNTATITPHASAAVGDLAVLFDYTYHGASAPAVGVPSGWTSIITQSSTPDDIIRAAVSYQVLTGLGSVTGIDSTQGAGHGGNKCMLVFHPDAPITSVVASTWNSQAAIGDPGSQSVNASGIQTPIVVFGVAAAASATLSAFSTASPAFDSVVANADADMITGYKLYNSGPANHTIDIGDNGFTNWLASGYLRVT